MNHFFCSYCCYIIRLHHTYENIYASANFRGSVIARDIVLFIVDCDVDAADVSG